ncbi:MAG: HU family DNA-binding protein [Chlamydiota bacterium]|nr:HU family DNA-binding protein [Chlamydiota bacterium]
MTKRDIAIRIANETGISQVAVKEVIQKTLDYIVESLGRNDKIELRNFGVFMVKRRDARVGRNPNKPEQEVHIPAKNVPYFKPGKEMKKVVEELPLVVNTDEASDTPPTP